MAASGARPGGVSAALIQVSNGVYEMAGSAFGRRLHLDAGELGVVAVDINHGADLAAITVLAAARHPERHAGVWPWATRELTVGSGQERLGAGVDGEYVVSTIDTVGDRDFFAVDLEAGQNYDISMFLKLLGPSGTPLPDSYIELYDSEGNLLVSADGGGTNTPEGLDAVLSFKADISGRYYINCQAFDQDATNGTTGVLKPGPRPFPFAAGMGYGLDLAVAVDPAASGAPVGPGTVSWGGSAGTWFWIDPVNDLFFIGMIQRLGGVGPGLDAQSRALVYQAIEHPPPVAPPPAAKPPVKVATARTTTAR